MEGGQSLNILHELSVLPFECEIVSFNLSDRLAGSEGLSCDFEWLVRMWQRIEGFFVGSRHSFANIPSDVWNTWLRHKRGGTRNASVISPIDMMVSPSNTGSRQSSSLEESSVCRFSVQVF